MKKFSDYNIKKPTNNVILKVKYMVICVPMEHLGVLCVCAFQIELEFGIVGF